MGIESSTGSGRRLLKVADGVIASLAFVASISLRNNVVPLMSEDIYGAQSLSFYLVFIVLSFFAVPIILERRGFYRLSETRNELQVGTLCLESSIIMFLIMVCFDFIFKIDSSRSIFIIFVPICTGLLFVREFGYALFHRRVFKDKLRRINVVMLTDRVGVTRCGAKLTNHPELGYQLVGVVAFAELSVDDFVKLLHEKSVGVVVFEVSPSAVRNVIGYVQACEDEGIDVWFAASFIETRVARAEVGYLDDLPIVIYKTTSGHVWQLIFKSMLDRCAAFLLIILGIPVFVLLAIGVKISSPGPIFFSQRRSGLHGRQFTMYKFRTMYVDAEERREQLLEKNEMVGPVFKIAEDPRVTKFGAMIRSHGLDELPQLWNVLVGEMSLVGPRPLPTYETQAIETNEQRRRLSVKPGLTCLWQISGRNDVKGFDDWVRLDLKYIDEWSLYLDLKILLLTIPAVLTGRGGR